MKHPLTSKERRGLVAVAAAALLCISVGVIARSCHHTPSPQIRIEKSDRSDRSDKSDKSDRSVKSDKSGKSRAKKSKASSAKDRSHLDESVD